VLLQSDGDSSPAVADTDAGADACAALDRARRPEYRVLAYLREIPDPASRTDLRRAA
jgi:hypothetical protein